MIIELKEGASTRCMQMVCVGVDIGCVSVEACNWCLTGLVPVATEFSTQCENEHRIAFCYFGTRSLAQPFFRGPFSPTACVEAERQRSRRSRSKQIKQSAVESSKPNNGDGQGELCTLSELRWVIQRRHEVGAGHWRREDCPFT